MEAMKVTPILIENDALGTFPKVLKKRLEDIEIKGRIETLQITGLLKLAGRLKIVLKKLAIIQIPMKNRQLMLMWKTYKE